MQRVDASQQHRTDPSGRSTADGAGLFPGASSSWMFGSKGDGVLERMNPNEHVETQHFTSTSMLYSLQHSTMGAHPPPHHPPAGVVSVQLHSQTTCTASTQGHFSSFFALRALFLIEYTPYTGLITDFFIAFIASPSHALFVAFMLIDVASSRPLCHAR